MGRTIGVVALTFIAPTLVAAAGVARAEGTADWKGGWAVEGQSVTRTLVAGGAGLSLQVELAGEPFTLSGTVSGPKLLLEGSGRAETPGIAGVLEGRKATGKPKVAKLEATLTSNRDGARVEARFSVDGKLVLEETWTRGALEIIALETESGKPLAGPLDVKVQGGLVVKFRVIGVARSVKLSVRLSPAHPHVDFYGGISNVATDFFASVSPGEYRWTWDGRDCTPAKRIALAGPYELTLEDDGAADDDGLPIPHSARRQMRSFEVAQPRHLSVTSGWINAPKGAYDSMAVVRSVNEVITTIANATHGSLWKTERLSVYRSADLAAVGSAAALFVSTHGGPATLAWYTTRTGEFSVCTNDLPNVKDLHFAIVVACSTAKPTSEVGRHGSVATNLVEKGCDYVIAMKEDIEIGEGVTFARIAFALIASGSPVEKASRDAARAAFVVRRGLQNVSEDELEKLMDDARPWTAVSRALEPLPGRGIPADESAFPPRYGNSSN